MEEQFKVMYMTLTSGVIRTFTFDVFEDDKQNARFIFHNTDNDKILTLFYHDVSYMITAPIRD